MKIKKYKEPNEPIKYHTVKEANEALRDYTDKYKGYYFVDQDDNDPYRNGSVSNELYDYWKWNDAWSLDPKYMEYINRDMKYKKQRIDERFNDYFENGQIANLPTVTKYGTPHLQVITYPFAGESYPYSSHSEVRGPNLLVSRKMYDPNYNFLFSNCSDSTYRFLDDVLGNEFDGSNSTWRPIMTPFIVEQLAKKVPGAKTIKEPDGLRDATITYIPLTKERMPAYKNAVAKGAKYYESLKKQGGRLIPRKFQFGGIPTLTLPDQTVYVGPKGGKSRVDVENEAMWKKAEPYYRELVAAGINPYVAVGVLGNIALESAFDPNANHHGKYHGLTQNQTDAKNWIIKNYGGYSKAHQMRFLVDGLMGKLQDSNKIPWQREFFKRFAGFNKATRNLRNIDAITDAWEKHYERSGGQGSPIRRRYANYFAKVLGLIN